MVRWSPRRRRTSLAALIGVPAILATTLAVLGIAQVGIAVWLGSSDPVVRLLWGEVATSMLTGAPGDGLEGGVEGGVEGPEPSRFGTLARLVWDPPLHYGHRGSS